MTDYSDLLEQAGRQYNVDPKLLASVMGSESAGNPGAVSPKGASGLMQLMPETAKSLGVTNIKDPKQNIFAGAQYLSQQLDKYGTPELALAAYNAGPGAVDKHGGIPPFPETQGYVKKTMASYQGQSQGMPGLPPTADAAAANDPFSALMAKAGGAPASKPVSEPGADPFSSLMAQADGRVSPNNNTSPVDIPSDLPAVTVTAKKLPAPSFADKAIGVGEAGLNLLTGAASAIPAGIAGLSSILSNGKYGTQAGVDEAAKRFHEVSGAYTYDPKTETGQQYAGAVGNAINDSGVVGLGPMVNVHGLAEAVKPASELAANGVKGKFNPLTGDAPVSRIEPTLPTQVKPRVKLNVDGTQTPVEASAASVAPASQNALTAALTPTIANATPELQNAVKALESKGKPVNPEVLQRHVEASSLPVPVKLTEGQATLDPATISNEMNSKGKQKATVTPEFYNAQSKALAGNLDAIRAKAAPDIGQAHPTEHGQALIDAYKTMDEPVRADITAKYKALEDANGGQFPLDGKTFVSNTEAALDKALKAGSVPADIQRSLDQFKNGRQMTFQDFETLRSDLADTMRTASDGRQRQAANIIREQLESMPLTPEAEQLKPLADAARNAAKSRFAKIDADPAYKAAVGDDVPAGTPSPLADKFINGYVTGNNVRGANLQQMKANLANDATAHQTIAAAAMDHLKGVAKADTETGKFAADSYRTAATSLTKKLPDLVGPEAAQQLEQLSKVAKYAKAQPDGSYVNNSNSLVAALSAPAIAVGRGLLAYKTMGASEAAGAAINAMKQGKAAKSSVAPGAGLNRLTNSPP